MLTEEPSSNLVAVIEINSIARNFLSSVVRNVYCEIEKLESNRKYEGSEESEWSTDGEDDPEKDRKLKNEMMIEEMNLAPAPVRDYTKAEPGSKKFYDQEENQKEREKRFNVEIRLGEKLTKVGHIDAFIDDIISVTSDKENTLDTDNVLILGDYKILGRVEDIYGTIDCPNYTICLDRYLKNMIESSELLLGIEVFVLYRLQNFIGNEILEKQKVQKGYDAENRMAEDGDEEPYYSDDEQEELEKIKNEGMLNKRGEKEMKAGRKGSGKQRPKNNNKPQNRGFQNQAPSGYQGSHGNVNQNQGLPPGMTTQQLFNQYLHDSVQQGVPGLFDNTHQNQGFVQPQMMQQQMVPQGPNIFNQGQPQNPQFAQPQAIPQGTNNNLFIAQHQQQQQPMGGQVFPGTYGGQMGQAMPNQNYGGYQNQMFQQANPGQMGIPGQAGGQMGVPGQVGGQNVMINNQAFNLSTEADYAFLRSQIDSMYNSSGSDVYPDPNIQNPNNNTYDNGGL